MDDLMIDSHKLMLHPERVVDYFAFGNPAPIYMEVSPSGACNHRCKFCALDYLGYKPEYLNVSDYVKFITHQEGIKSVMFGGEGEPLMHRHFTDIVAATYVRGIDCALTTNGVLLTPQRTEIVKMMKWIKISIDAGTADIYHKVHGTSTRDWQTLWRNIENLVKVKGKCKVGLQFLLLEDNEETLIDFLAKASNSGVDYAVIKAYSQHLKSKNRQAMFTPEAFREECDEYEHDNFKIITRSDNSIRMYKQCLALPFWRYLQANGDLWVCSAHIGDERFRIGNIKYNQENNGNAIKAINIINQMMETFDINNCRLNCRMNNCNEYLNRLKYPKEHDNFI